LLRKQQPCVREYIGYDRLEGFEEQALLAAVYRPLVPLLNFFMDRPRSPFQRLSESEVLPREIKDALVRQYALYNPVELQHSVNKALLRLRQRLAQVNRKQTQEPL
jgi:hypothetical protein